MAGAAVTARRLQAGAVVPPPGVARAAQQVVLVASALHLVQEEGHALRRPITVTQVHAVAAGPETRRIQQALLSSSEHPTHLHADRRAINKNSSILFLNVEYCKYKGT